MTHILSHLSPLSLSSIALVSHRFHSLVTTPHAWRIAFARYFPGRLSIEDSAPPAAEYDSLLFDRRHFSRLTALASWRSEYILRTRLLRSLSRGKPAILELPGKHGNPTRSATPLSGSAVVTFTSQLLYPITHLDGSFGSADSREPLFIHGAAEQGMASASNASSAKVGTWGLSDHQFFRHFADLFPGETEYGLGSGNLVGLPNCMDVSQPFGVVYGEGCPQGRSYYISSSEQRGHFLDGSDSISQPSLGIPALNIVTASTCAVWIAKSVNVPKATGGVVGILSGSSTGVLSAYALGPHSAYSGRFDRGQVTARWVLSPGVPIISIAVDEKISPSRYGRQRIWAAVLNALGEVFFITDLPQQPDTSTKLGPEEVGRVAWKTGRSVRWELIEASRRRARPDPFSRESVDGSYTPRSSSDSMDLDVHQLAAETREIESFLARKPKHFRKVCEGWDMRRDLQVDFAGDDDHGCGEAILVITRGFADDSRASIRRYAREKVKSRVVPSPMATEPFPPLVGSYASESVFGGRSTATESPCSCFESPSSTANTEWKVSGFSFAGSKSVRITCSSLDNSTFSQITADEDPLMTSSAASSSSFISPRSSPIPRMAPSPEIPGRRARYMAVGTTAGTVYVWDIRSPAAQSSGIVNTITPLRIIQTESPQVNCVALTALYLVHGGNDGLVQAWDPLASSKRPVRTINSRFSSRARRRLVQAEASLLGVGSNYFAAGAICLDPDPTALRGIVSLGTYLRYWSYSTSSADQYKGSKRRLRPRFPNGGNSSPEGQRFSVNGRSALKDHIEGERREMERQKVANQKEKAYLNSRFGVGLLGHDVSEDELVAYAQFLSEESYTSDAARRGEVPDGSVASTSPSDAVGGIGETSTPSFAPEDLNHDIAEAIRLSLLDDRPPASSSFSAPPSCAFTTGNAAGPAHFDESGAVESSRQQEMDDLELALQLSLVDQEQQNRVASKDDDHFPALGTRGQASVMSRSSQKKGKSRVVQ